MNNFKRDIVNAVIPNFNDIYVLFSCSNSINEEFTCTLLSEIQPLLGKILKYEEKDIWCMFIKVSDEFYIRISQNEFHFGKIYKGEAIYDMENYHRWIYENNTNNDNSNGNSIKFVREWNEGFITTLRKKDVDDAFSPLRRFIIKRNFITTKELSVSLNKEGKQIIHSQKNIQEIIASEEIINTLLKK